MVPAVRAAHARRKHGQGNGQMNAIFQPVQHKLTVEAYYALARTGHLGEDDRVELIDGATCPQPLPGVSVAVSEVLS